QGDFFITVTGCKNVLNERHFQLMKDGAVLANAGHFDVEINKPALKKLSASCRTVRQNIEEYTQTDGRRLYLLAEGRLVNLAAGDGHPAEIMDLSFALQALCARYIIRNRTILKNRVYRVPEEIDRQVAEMKLASLGLQIDRLSEEQEEYLKSSG
ncbi:MAG: adenosylhomocysteinase, partial [Desulfotomaculales bacterium]